MTACANSMTFKPSSGKFCIIDRFLFEKKNKIAFWTTKFVEKQTFLLEKTKTTMDEQLPPTDNNAEKFSTNPSENPSEKTPQNLTDPLRPFSSPPKTKVKRWAKIRRAALGLGLILVSLLAIALVAASIFEDKIGALIVREVNRQLKTPIVVQRVSLSLFSDFPSVSADLDGVFAKDAFGGTLLKARQVSFRMGLMSLFSDEIAVHSVVVRDGILVLKTDASGRQNFDIFKPSKSKKSLSVSMSIEKAQLENLRVIFQNAPSVFSTDLTIKSASLTGKFGSEKFSLQSKADLMTAYVRRDSLVFLEKKPIQLNAKITVDLPNNLFKFDDVMLDIAANQLTVTGLVQEFKNGTLVKLTAEDRAGSLAKLFQLLPPKYAASMEGIESSGDFSFKGTANGLISPTSTPTIQAALRLRKGVLVHPKIRERFENIAFEAIFDGQNFSIPNATGTFAGQPLRFNFKMENAKTDPSVFFDADGILPLGWALGFVGNDRISDATGSVRCQNLTLNGRLSDLKNGEFSNAMTASGKLNFEHNSLKVNGELVKLDGALTFDNNTFSVQNFTFKGVGSDATISGNASNWLPVLLADSTNQADLTFAAKLESNNLDIQKIIGLQEKINVQKAEKQAEQTKPTDAKSAKSTNPKINDTPQYFPILNRLKGTFESSFGAFSFGKLTGKNFKGQISLAGNRSIALHGMTTAMNGFWQLDGWVALERQPLLFAKLMTASVNISEFFKQTDNFGQTFLTNQNISGRLTAKFAISAAWNDKWNFDVPKLHVLADVAVADGELVGLKLLESFSKYVKIEDLQRVKFVTLQNQLEIINRKLYLPAMFVQTNALNLQVAAVHSFDQDLDYNIIVNAEQVLMSRFRSHNPNLEPQADKRNGWLNLFYHIGGNLDNFTYRSDKSAVKMAFADSEKRRTDIETQLAQIFGGQNPVGNPPTAATTTPSRNNRDFPNGQQHLPKKTDKKNADEPQYLPGF